jgi:hypothetical protein
MRAKIDVMERVKKFQLLAQSKQGPNQNPVFQKFSSSSLLSTFFLDTSDRDPSHGMQLNAW